MQTQLQILWSGQYLNANRAAAWMGYYWILPDIIGYFRYSFKMYGNNGMFYGGTKI